MRKLNGGAVVLVILTMAWFHQTSRLQCMAADPERISVEQLKNMLDAEADVVVVDTRDAQSHQDGHIPRALSMSFPTGIRARNDELPRDKTIILY